jgi:GAF domain-containing protein
VEGPRPAASIAAVLAYAGARETDKRSLAREALDRYRELNLIYDVADQIGAVLETDAIAQVAVSEASRLPSGGIGFVLLLEADGSKLSARPVAGDTPNPILEHDPSSGIVGAVLTGDPEIVNDIAGDPRATAVERAFASLVAAPLRVRGERIGVIGTIARDPTEYHASDLRLLGAIASLAAPTLDQAAAVQASRNASDASGATGG